MSNLCLLIFSKQLLFFFFVIEMYMNTTITGENDFNNVSKKKKVSCKFRYHSLLKRCFQRARQYKHKQYSIQKTFGLFILRCKKYLYIALSVSSEKHVPLYCLLSTYFQFAIINYQSSHLLLTWKDVGQCKHDDLRFHISLCFSFARQP